MKKNCDNCCFDPEDCYKCEFVSRKKVFGKPKKLKFFSVEYQELWAQKFRDFHIKI